MINHLDITERFFMQASKHSKHLAIIENNNNISYNELAILVKRFAKLASNYGQNPKVAINLPQGISAYAAILGVTFAGGTYCPINTHLPLYRKEKILKNFEPDLVIHNRHEDIPIIKDYKYFNIDLLPDSTLKKHLQSNECLYVIYTSGSTGEPKGIAIKRSAVSQFISWSIEATNVSYKDKWGQFSNLGFDLSVMDIFTSLGGGSTLVSLNSLNDRLMPAKAIKSFGLTIWHSVPSVIDLMNKAGHITHEHINTLRLMSFCGEPLFSNQIKTILNAKNDLTIFNTYGPTETTVFCTQQIIHKDNYLDICNITAPIGSPIPGWGLLLTNGEDEQNGEIMIYGEHIGIGYWRNPEATKRVYKEITINNQKTRAFLTGDLAEFKNGHLYFLNRKDRQVKIRGYRVELSEIDSYIRQFGISNSATITLEGKLISCLESKETPDLEKLTYFLSERLPFYSLPSKFITINEFPRNFNDKIDLNKILDIVQKEL